MFRVAEVVSVQFILLAVVMARVRHPIFRQQSVGLVVVVLLTATILLVT